MENINDLIWLSENDNGDDGKGEGNKPMNFPEPPPMKDLCMIGGFCGPDSAYIASACGKENPYRSGACLPNY